MSNVSNAAKRRELRKEKILKNAELRKQKIFGIGISESSAELHTNDKNSSVVNEGDISIAAAQQYDILTEKSIISDNKCIKFESPFDVNASNYSSDIEKLNDYLRSIPDPLIEVTNKTKVDDELTSSSDLNYSSGSFDSSMLEENESIFTNPKNLSDGLSRTSFLSTSINSQSGISSKLCNSSDKKSYLEPPQTIYLFDHPVAPCLLALLVSLLLTYNFGSLVSHSLLIPFCIWELQLFISIYGSNGNNNKNTFLLSAILLCGIKKDVVEKYIWISDVCRDIIEDFSIYIFTIVLWHLIVGFPNEIGHS